MDLKLNVQKRGLSTTAETINEEFTLHYGHIFKGEKGDKGEKGADGKDGERGADGKSAYQQAVEAGYKGSEEDFKELLLSYPNKADKEGYYPNMSVGIADDVKNGNTKYLAATPSGDPMHYAYEAIGARWNADTGYWEFYDMKDITNVEMSKALARGSWYIGNAAIGVLSAQNEQSLSAIRFNLARTGGWSVTCDMDDFAQGNSWIEFINLTFDNNLVSQPFTYATYLQNSFVGCSNLRRIYGEINVGNSTALATPFTGCAKLEDVQIFGLKQNISFADSPLLSKESLLYMIHNCASGVSFTITLHPDVYAKCQLDGGTDDWLLDINNAIDEADMGKDTLITLASA